MRKRGAIWLAWGALWMAPLALCTTLAPMSVAQMTQAASVVARARCLGTRSQWEDGEIWTRARFRVAEVWKGRAPGNIEVRLLGGRSGHLVSTVAGVPQFVPGEEVVLFLERTRSGALSVTGFSEGTFRLRHDAAGRVFAVEDSAALMLHAGAEAGGDGGAKARRPMALVELHREVLEAQAKPAGTK